MFKRKIYFFIVLMLVLGIGCKTKHVNAPSHIFLDTAFLDSIKKKADTIYSKRYPRTDLPTVEYAINHIDSTNMQLLKDTLNVIREVIVAQKKIRIYFAQYYANGQLKQKFNLDKFGQYDGTSKEYYENGFLKSEGLYKGGFYIGKWKNYRPDGILESIDEYNQAGQKINTDTLKND